MNEMIKTKRIGAGHYELRCGDTYIVLKKNGKKGKWKSYYHELSLSPANIPSQEFHSLYDGKVYAYDMLAEYA